MTVSPECILSTAPEMSKQELDSYPDRSPERPVPSAPTLPHEGMHADRLKLAVAALQEGIREPDDVLAAVSEQHGVSVGDLLGRNVSKAVARARHEAIRDVYFDTDLNGPETASFFGVTPSVVYHVLKKHREGQI